MSVTGLWLLSCSLGLDVLLCKLFLFLHLSLLGQVKSRFSRSLLMILIHPKILRPLFLVRGAHLQGTDGGYVTDGGRVGTGIGQVKVGYF